MSNALLYIFLGAIFDTFGDLVMKNWVMNNNKYYFIIGMFFYVIGLSFLAYSFTLKNMVVASVLFLIMNIIFLTLINSFYFSEFLSKKEYVAVGIGIIAIVLFEIK